MPCQTLHEPFGTFDNGGCLNRIVFTSAPLALIPMSLIPEDEVLQTPRRNAFTLFILSVVLIGIGLWGVTKLGKADWIFAWVWGSLWFLGGGAGFVNGIRGLINPPVYAKLSADGLALPSLRIRHIVWSDILDARLAPKTITNNEGTHYLFKEPIILRLRDDTALKSGAAALWTKGITAPLDDGTVEVMLETQSCPLSSNILLARIQSRLLGEPVPVLPVGDVSAATFGGLPLQQVVKKSKSTAVFAGVFAMFGLCFAGLGVRCVVHAHASLEWPATEGHVESCSVERDSDHNSRLNIRYNYAVDGRSYTGRRLAFFTWGGDHAGYLRQYPVGTAVRVYYQPDRPDNAVIIQGGSGGWFIVGFGLIFAVASASIIRFNVNSRSRVGRAG